MNTLNRFLEAQEGEYGYALALHEVSSGRKTNHWIWYIFPQMKGLGISYNSENYGIADEKEAEAYLSHPVLGRRLREITKVLLALDITDLKEVFGSDAKKVRSCMVLFSSLESESSNVFAKTLVKFQFKNRR